MRDSEKLEDITKEGKTVLGINKKLTISGYVFPNFKRMVLDGPHQVYNCITKTIERIKIYKNNEIQK